MSYVATEKKSALAVKIETAPLTGTAASTGTAVTGSGTQFTTELVVGNTIGNATKGWRTVVAIGSDTALTVDFAFTYDLSADTILKQAVGTSQTMAAGNVIEWKDFTAESKRDEIARDVNNNSYDDVEPVSGMETVSATISAELHGSGTAGVSSEQDALWQAAIGERTVTVSATTTAASTTTLVKLGAGGSGFRAGQHIILDPSAGGTGAYEVTRITEIATNDLTVYPALSVAPPTGRAIAAAVHYRPSITELHSLALHFYRGGITLEKYRGCKVSGLTLDYTAGQTINPSFTLEGMNTEAPTASAYTLGTPTPDAGVVHVARLMTVSMGGASMAASNVSLNIANELFNVTALTTTGVTNVIRVKRTITGSFSVFYANKDIEDAFRNGTTATLMLVSSTGGTNLVVGNTVAISLPKIKYTAVPKSKDNGIYKYDVSFRAARTLGEDSIFVSFL